MKPHHNLLCAAIQNFIIFELSDGPKTAYEMAMAMAMAMVMATATVMGATAMAIKVLEKKGFIKPNEPPNFNGWLWYDNIKWKLTFDPSSDELVQVFSDLFQEKIGFSHNKAQALACMLKMESEK